MKNGEHIILDIRKTGQYGFSVTDYPLSLDADMGAGVIDAFLVDLEAGRINLIDVYPCLPRDELAAIPELATSAKYNGVTL